jgi:type VI secretion system secreted protein VgrG
MAALSGIQAALAAAPAHAANPQKTHWIEIEMVDEDNKPVPGEPYAITLPDGSVASGTLDEKGFARIEGLDPGTCQVAFTNRGKDEWKPK